MTLSRSSVFGKLYGYFYLVLILPFLLVLVSCTEIEDPVPFKPTSTINKLFIVGSQVENGDLVLYVNGTDKDGSPFTEADLKLVNVVVGTETDTEIYNDTTDVPLQDSVDVTAVGDGDGILSLTFLSDYSGSIPDTEFTVLSSIHNLILDALPSMYEIQVINFSDDPKLRLKWTESSSDVNSSDYIAIRNAVEVDDQITRNGTALYDSVGYALDRDLGSSTDGLIERCRPARMLIAFSDGEENWSTLYTDRATLVQKLRENNILTIMLGNENSNLDTLTAFAGKTGAVVQMSNASDIESQIINWKDSLSGMVSVRIRPATNWNDILNTVTLRMNSGQEVIYSPESGGVCP